VSRNLYTLVFLFMVAGCSVIEESTTSLALGKSSLNSVAGSEVFVLAGRRLHTRGVPRPIYERIQWGDIEVCANRFEAAYVLSKLVELGRFPVPMNSEDAVVCNIPEAAVFLDARRISPSEQFEGWIVLSEFDAESLSDYLPQAEQYALNQRELIRKRDEEERRRRDAIETERAQQVGKKASLLREVRGLLYSAQTGTYLRGGLGIDI